MSEEDAEASEWWQLEQSEQQRLEEESKQFRRECREFEQEFTSAMRRITKGNENADTCNGYWWEGFQKGS